MTHKLPDHIRGVLFDLDGTLLDSMGVWTQIDIDFLGNRGIKVPDDYMQAIGAMGPKDTAHYTIARFGLSDTPEELMEEWHQMSVIAYKEQVQLKPGGKELLLALKARGIRLGVVSALEPELAEPCLRRNGVLELFDGMVHTDHTLGSKSNPFIWEKAAAALGLKTAECAAIDDVAAALQGAKAAGLYTIGMKDPHSGKFAELTEAAAFTIDTLDEIEVL